MTKESDKKESQKSIVKKCKWPGKGPCPFKKNIAICPYETDKPCLDPMPESDPRRK
jgi:hypothetical protein